MAGARPSKARARIPKYCRHKSTNRAYVRLPTRPRATVVYLGVFGSPESRRLYQETIAGWLEGGARGGEARTAHVAEPPGPTDLGPTVAEVADAFLAHARGYYRKRGEETTQVGIVEVAMRDLKAWGGGGPAGEFDASALKKLRAGIVASGLSRGGVNRRVSIVKQCLGWAVEEGLIPPAGWHSCLAVRNLKRDRTPAPETEDVEPVPVEVVEATIPKAPAPVAAMIRLQLLTGMRPDEACQVRRSDLDEASDPWIYRPDRHKSEHHGHRREIPIGPRAQAILREWFGRDAESPLFSPRAWTEMRRRARRAARKSKVQPSQADRSKPGGRERPPGDCYSEASYRRAIGRAAKAAKQPHWTPNQLRHTYATLVRARYGLEASQVLLGHASADVTQIYAERDLKKAAEIAAEIG